MFVSEQPGYCAAAGCSLLHFLAAAGTSFAPLGAFSEPVFSTYPTESGAGLKICSQNFTLGTPRVFFCSTFFFHWRHPRTFFSSYAFCVCSNTPVLTLFSSVASYPILFQCRNPPLAQSNTDADLIVWPVLHISFLVRVCECEIITPHISRVQVVHALCSC